MLAGFITHMRSKFQILKAVNTYIYSISYAGKKIKWKCLCYSAVHLFINLCNKENSTMNIRAKLPVTKLKSSCII